MDALHAVITALAVLVIFAYLTWLVACIVSMLRWDADDPRWEEVSELQRLERERDMFRRY